MEKQKIININDCVKVKLNKIGEDVLLEEYGKKATKYFLSKKDSNGFIDIQLWEFMNLFGGLMFHGNADLPFETNLIIETNNDKDIEIQNAQMKEIRKIIMKKQAFNIEKIDRKELIQYIYQREIEINKILKDTILKLK